MNTRTHTPMETCKNGTHEKVVFDKFAKDFGGRRMPGDCYCMDCHSPIPAIWNRGHPISIPDDQRKAAQ